MIQSPTSTAASLIDELYAGRGLSRRDLARVAEVSDAMMRAIRQNPERATLEQLIRLDHLALFLRELEHRGIEDPAAWLEVYLPLPVGYRISGMDLYLHLRGFTPPLIEIAIGRREAAAVLDEVWPSWREDRYSRYDIVPGADGYPVIVARRDEPQS